MDKSYSDITVYGAQHGHSSNGKKDTKNSVKENGEENTANYTLTPEIMQILQIIL